ncbi:MAG: type II toxin-antitoxin system PemK/MazF family toxin [Actinomycetota bacterium]
MDRGDIVRAPFEYSDLTGDKRRPACVVSVEAFNRTGDVVIAMITSRQSRLAAPSFGDVVLENWQEEGLLRPSVLRAGRLLARSIDMLSEPRGRLRAGDLRSVEAALRKVFGL